MDTDKEKPIPEDQNNVDDQKKQPQDLQDAANHAPLSTTTETPVSPPPPSETTQVDVGDGEGDVAKGLPESEEVVPTTSEEDQQQQEASPLSPPPDLPKVSQEIDHYITSLLSSLKQDVSSSSSAPETVPICVEQFAVLFEAKIDEYDSVDSPVKWNRLTDEDSESFLDAIHRISKLYSALCEFSSDCQFAYSINRIGTVLQRAMSYLEEEFRFLMEDYKIPDSDYHQNPVPPEKLNDQHLPEGDETPEQNQGSEEKDDDDHLPRPTNQEENVDICRPEIGYSDEGLSNLRKLSKAMIQGGYETECCQVYFITRRNALEETLHKFGSEKHSIDDVVQKMNWESLEREIMAWIKTFKQCANSEFPRERKISDFVFHDYPQVSESIFSTLTKGVIVELVNFSEAVAMTKRAAEKLFKFLDIYETLRDVLPTVDNLFPKESVHLEEIKSEATLTRSRLGEAMVYIFCELENSIKADTGKTPVPGGAVHPLTRYTINYLKYACEYKDTLEQVFREHQKIERADSTAGSDFDYNTSGSTTSGVFENNSSNNNNKNSNDQKIQISPFQSQLLTVMDLLDQNLEIKSKLYKDLSLSSIFMMNNGRYILQKVRGSPEVSSLMGDAWCRKRSSDLRQYHKNYQRETWGKLLHCLMNHEGLNVNGKVVKPVLKERFKSFNAMFDEIHKTQSGWVVSDEQLQSELRVSISNMVIPAYRAFLARYGQTLTPGRQTEKYVKHQPEEIEELVDELFDGNAANPAGRRKL
ncbi:OLC1v1011889C1 [Oldenlandia corymbosa var. corymbosa]|uniref:Exocyst subunit Exo70 family protein n=1 Tax=Oldenlandia corymbosa var. corymbosa TaxID=529605 RepID=A0AAV1DUT8_OLDCO|nr:OLC1v1011889C1 [Oldenlandia corymbosa var. corymbosa]